MAITIKDIARHSGVSVSTVSRVLNKKPDVNTETPECLAMSFIVAAIKS